MFKDLVKKSRSYRGFDSSYQFTREELTDLVDCARYAPASVNMQPLKYYLAMEKEKIGKIISLVRMGALLPAEKLPHKGMEPTGVIVICHDKTVSPSPNAFQKDVGVAAQTILLAAAEKGLGGCIIGNFNAEKMRNSLELPETITPVLCIALGKPAETIILEEIGPEGSTKYYRDETGNHHVPKRRLADILLN